MADGPSPSLLRARRLLVGGLVGGHLAGLACVLAFGIFAGLRSAASAAIAAAVVLLFFTIGQGIQVAVADAPARTVLIVALASYLTRVGLLGALLMLALGNAASLAVIEPTSLVVSTISVVIGWLVGEVRAYVRLRIPVFDSTETDVPQGKRPR